MRPRIRHLAPVVLVATLASGGTVASATTSASLPRPRTTGSSDPNTPNADLADYARMFCLNVSTPAQLIDAYVQRVRGAGGRISLEEAAKWRHAAGLAGIDVSTIDLTTGQQIPGATPADSDAALAAYARTEPVLSGVRDAATLRSAYSRRLAALGGQILGPETAIWRRAAELARIDVFMFDLSTGRPVTTAVDLQIVGDRRVITSNGVPAKHGTFPNAHDPFAMAPTPQRFSITTTPVANAQVTPLVSNKFGVALDGVIFDPGGPFLGGDPSTGWQFEPLKVATVGRYLGVDANNAHTQGEGPDGGPQPGGQPPAAPPGTPGAGAGAPPAMGPPAPGRYHYHGVPTALYRTLTKRNGGERAAMTLLGYAADGFPIYSTYAHSDPTDLNSPLVRMRSGYRLKQGARPASVGGHPLGGTYDGSFVQDYEYVGGRGRLDPANGRFGRTREYPGGTYYYVLTKEWPQVPRALRGTGDPSFSSATPGLQQLPPELGEWGSACNPAR